MSQFERSEDEIRETIIDYLSDDEYAQVSSKERIAPVDEGEEYIDFTALDQGVKRAAQPAVLTGPVLPRRAVPEHAWKGIVTELVPLLNPKKERSPHGNDKHASGSGTSSATGRSQN